MLYKELYKRVLDILIDWDPLNIKEDMPIGAANEYETFVPQFISRIKSEEEIFKYLEEIETNIYSTGYNPNNLGHVNELKEIAHKIFTCGSSIGQA